MAGYRKSRCNQKIVGCHSQLPQLLVSFFIVIRITVAEKHSDILRSLPNHRNSLQQSLNIPVVGKGVVHFRHYKDNVIILGGVPGRVGVGALAVYRHNPNAFIPPGEIKDQVNHFLLCTHLFLKRQIRFGYG